MLMNQDGEHRLVQIAPDRATTVTNLSASVNHQTVADWPEHAAFTKTIERKIYLDNLLENQDNTSEQLIKSFLKAPLFNRKYKKAFGTIYTAMYQPKYHAIELIWHGIKLRQSFSAFKEGVTTIGYRDSSNRRSTYK